jgi:hypothetical protein
VSPHRYVAETTKILRGDLLDPESDDFPDQRQRERSVKGQSDGAFRRAKVGEVLGKRSNGRGGREESEVIFEDSEVDQIASELVSWNAIADGLVRHRRGPSNCGAQLPKERTRRFGRRRDVGVDRFAASHRYGTQELFVRLVSVSTLKNVGNLKPVECPVESG